MKEIIHKDNVVTVVYDGIDFAALPRAIEAKLSGVVRTTAFNIERRMKLLIIERGFVDTRATVNSVATTIVSNLMAEVGPSTHYAIYGEMGYTQTQAWGRPLKHPIIHQGLWFARDAAEAVRTTFTNAVREVLRRVP